jgi:hypothetical protein
MERLPEGIDVPPTETPSTFLQVGKDMTALVRTNILEYVVEVSFGG